VVDLPADPQDLARLAAQVAADAGRMLLATLGERREQVATKTTTTDMVTEMDHRSEALIVAALIEARPDDGVVGEEGARIEGTSGIQWVIDPLDGTTNYLYGYPGWGVSIAATADGRSVAGAVVDPMHDDAFVAALGAGATLNGSPLTLGPPPPLEEALVATGFAYDAERRGHQAAALAHVLPRVRDMRRGGAAAVDLCWVACGRLDGFFERGLQPWDLAAGSLVASEAGAAVEIRPTGTPPRPLVVAATPPLFGALCALIEEAGVPDA
jgi:myo-inositol-1(or 4)-monophosphatase